MYSPRIVSLLSAATEMLYALGLVEQVVGVSHECDWPPQVQGLPRLTRSRVDESAASGAIDQAVRTAVAAGAALYAIDAETLCRLAPDLIVTQAQCDVCAVSHEDVLALVATRPELAATQVVALNPQSLEEILADLERIGAAVGVPEQAAQVVAVLHGRIEAIASISRKIPPPERPRVACIEWIEPLMLAGNWVPDLVDLAGGRCELTTAGEHSRYHEWSEIRQFDPQVVLIAACGFDLARTREEARQLTHLPGWGELTAVRENRVWAVDGNALFNRSGPRIVDSLELLAHLTHPQRYELPAACRELVAPMA